MKGPIGSLFEPSEYKINIKQGNTCDDLSFKLKGFLLTLETKIKNADGNLNKGPIGLQIQLKKGSL